jgi:putative drug exporter of the RND superfamily
MFGRLGAWAQRRRVLVVVMWVVTILIGGGVLGSVGEAFSTEFSLPDVESRRGLEVLEAEMDGNGSGMDGTIVFRSEEGFDDPAVRERIEVFLSAIDELDDTTVQSPFADDSSAPPAELIEWYAQGAAAVGPEAADLLANGGSERISGSGGEAGRIAYATLEVPGDTDMRSAMELGEEIRSFETRAEGLQIEYGGQIFEEFEPPAAELIGLAFAIVILIVAFGSVMAMGLPIGVALAGIGLGSILLGLLSNLVEMPDFATTLGIMIGLGVGIDYALFIVTRFREQVHAGHTVEESISIAIDTSGRAVTFAGITVVISLLGMLLMGVSFVQGLGIGAAMMVAVTMVASLTLLPALLGFVGGRLEVTRWRGIISAGLVSVFLIGLGLRIEPLRIALPLAGIVLLAGFAVAPLRREVVRRPPKPLHETLAYRWSRVVQSRPWPLALVAAAALILLAVPVSGIRLGFSDASNAPQDSSARQAYELLVDGFGPGYNGRILLVSDLPDGYDASDSAPFLEISRTIAAVDGVAEVSPPVPSDMDRPADSGAVLWQVFPTTSPQDEATTELVRDLRERVLPQVAEMTGVEVMVTGSVGIMTDFADYLADRLFVFFAAVLTLSFLLLMLVFRSILVPVKAVIMNLLSIGAAYGVIVAIFQWGWMKDVFGVEPAPIEPFIPMMLFAIVFGLSMDYEVFLLSRIREEWLRTGDSRSSVANGLAATARVISAAAAIMVVVFGSFLLEADRTIKLMGFGLALAVLLDATVVRMLLVPATMELLGDKNWWFPNWLGRLLPTINVEGSHDEEPPTEAPGGDGVRELEPTH